MELQYCNYKNLNNFINNQYNEKVSLINKFNFFSLENITGKYDLGYLIDNLFYGRYIEMPRFCTQSNNLGNKYSRFEEFTSKDEVNNLSNWIIGFIQKYCMHEFCKKVGKELEILQRDNPRDGRLDVVAQCDKTLVSFETKVTLKSLIRENRYSYQIPNYKKEIENTITKLGQECEIKKVFVLLLIGGEETDLYPENHIDCTTGKIGNIAKIFYDSIQAYDIKFISANAIWAIMAKNEIEENSINWNEIIEDIYINKNAIGFLTGGAVIRTNNNIQIMNYDYPN